MDRISARRGINPASRRWLLLPLAGALLVFHVGLLAARLSEWQALDATVILRWALSAFVLIVLKQLGTPSFSNASPGLGLAAVLAFSLIHTPATAPEPAMPIAATGLGVALSLAAWSPRAGALTPLPALASFVRHFEPAWNPVVSREALKDRGPPAAA